MRIRFFKWMREKSLYLTYFIFPYMIILAYLIILISFLNNSLLFPVFLYFTVFYFIFFYIGLKFDTWSSSIKRNINGIPTELKRYKTWLRTFSGGLSLFCILMLCIVPLITQNDYYLGSFFVIAMIYTIFAASWDFLAGYTGQVSFGQAAFFGFAAYVTGDRLLVQNWHWLPSLLFGALMAVVISLVIGIPALRLKGPYLALGTLSFASILYLLFAMPTILYGSTGLFGVPRLSRYIVVEYYVVLIFMILTLIIMKIIVNSKLGTIFKSIRDDETGAEASGINTTKYKIYAFMISAFFAGIAGGFYVMRTYSVSAGIFLATYSFYPLVMVAIGGIATISGSALGAFFFVFLTEGLRGIVDIEGVPLLLSQWLDDSLIFALLLILVIRFAGAGALKSAMERLKDVWDLILGR